MAAKKLPANDGDGATPVLTPSETLAVRELADKYLSGAAKAAIGLIGVIGALTRARRINSASSLPMVSRSGAPASGGTPSVSSGSSAAPS